MPTSTSAAIRRPPRTIRFLPASGTCRIPQPAAVDAVDAWTLTTGSNGVVIAELDTGVRFDHPDLRSDSANRLLPGYDMISSVQTGNTGEGRNADASDPGDWVTSADTKTALFANCTVGNSSWHGTRVAGILGAVTNNSTGIAGMTWSGWVLPVRVLGKCGGYDSDIIAAHGLGCRLPGARRTQQSVSGAHHQHEPGGGGCLPAELSGCDRPAHQLPAC